MTMGSSRPGSTPAGLSSIDTCLTGSRRLNATMHSCSPVAIKRTFSRLARGIGLGPGPFPFLPSFPFLRLGPGPRGDSSSVRTSSVSSIRSSSSLTSMTSSILLDGGLSSLLTSCVLPGRSGSNSSGRILLNSRMFDSPSCSAEPTVSSMPSRINRRASLNVSLAFRRSLGGNLWGDTAS